MPITDVKASNDGYITSANANYDTARNAIAGNQAITIILYIGQLVTPIYGIRRPFASFQIPDMVSLTAASLFLNGAADFSTTDFDIYIHLSTYSDPLVKEDFDLFDGHQASGAYNGTILNNAWNSVDYSAGWNEIVFNAAGLSAVLAAKNSTLKIVLISKEDYDNSVPTYDEYCAFNSSETAGNEPYLSITYTAPPPPVDVSGISDAILTSLLSLTTAKIGVSSVSNSELLSDLLISRDVQLSGLSNSVLNSGLFFPSIFYVSGSELIKLYTRNHLTVAGEEITHGIIRGY